MLVLNRFGPAGKLLKAVSLLVLLQAMILPACYAQNANQPPAKTVLETGTVTKTVIQSPGTANGSDSGSTSGKGPSASGSTKSGKGYTHRHHHHGQGSGHGHGGSGHSRGSGSASKKSHHGGPGTASHKPVHRKSVPAIHKAPAPKPKPLLNMTAVPDVRAAALQLVQSGRLQSADWLLKKALEFNPQDTGLSNDLAAVALERAKKLIEQGYLECALIRLREALFMNPDLTEAEELINAILRKQGHDPENPDERLKLADGLARDHRYIAAIVEYRESLKLRPSAEAYTGLGDMYARAGQSEMAQSAYQQALAINPMYSIAQSRTAGFARPPAADSTDLQNPHAAAPAPIKDVPPGVLLAGLWRDQSLSRYMEFARNAARTARFARTTTGGQQRPVPVQTIVPQGKPQMHPIAPTAPGKLPDFLLMNPELPQDIDGEQLPDKYPTKISQRLPAAETEHCACQ